MITDSRKLALKIVALCAILLLAFGFLCSCKENGENDKYAAVFSDGEEEEWNAEHEYEKYAIIIPSESSADIYNAAKRIGDKLSENTGAYSEVFYSHEKIPSGSDVCKIFVGDTGDADVQKYLKGFRVKDIGYKYRDKTVCIGAITEDALLSALELFFDDVAVYSDKEFFMNNGTEKLIKGEYSVGEIKLNGFSLSEYTLVFPRKNTQLRDLAIAFQKEMLDESGYLLRVSSDYEIDKKSKAILIGNCDIANANEMTSDFDRAKILKYDTGIMIISSEQYGIEQALAELKDQFLQLDSERNANVIIAEPVELVFETDNVKILTLSLEREAVSLDDIVMAVEEIYDKSPDIVRLEGVSESSAQKISNNFVDTYSLISVSENIYHMVLTEKYVFEISSHPSSEDEIGIVEYFNTDGKALLSFIELKSDNISDNAKSILGDIFSGSSKEMIIAFSNMDRVTAESLYGNAVSIYEMLGENPVSDDHIPYFFGYGFCIGEYNASYVLSFFCSETSVNIYS